ncbi:MAG: PDZ domain-containing protein, partial [Psychrobium sp.]
SYNKDGLLTLSRVYADSAAWKAGLNTGDQIVAINGLKVTQGSLKTRLAQYKVGEEVTLSLFRRDRLVDKTLTLTAKKNKKPMIRVVKNPSNKQKAFYKAWRGVELEVPKSK